MDKFKNDIFSPEEALFNISEVLEPSDKTNGSILCTLKGNFFFPDGYSRNKRFYPKELWERAINQPNVTKKIGERRFYGTISHEQNIDDKAFLEGKISHAVTKLEITNEGEGYGELIVFDTPAGKIINTFARANSKLFLSTRGSGTFKGEKDGLPIVNPETFILESVDFVLEPGFEQASPEILEALKNLNNPDNGEGEGQMDKIIEKLQAQVEAHMKENRELREKLEATETQLDQVSKENETLIKSNEALTEAKENLEAYKGLGTVEEIEQLIERAPKIMESWSKFNEIGDTPEQIKEALLLANKFAEAYEPLGKPHEIKEALDLLVNFKDEVDAIGTIEELNQAISLLESISEQQKVAERKEAVTKLAKELNVTEAKIDKVYGKMTEEEIREMFEGLADDLAQYRPPKTVNENNDEDEEDEDALPKSFNRSLASRLVEKYNN